MKHGINKPKTRSIKIFDVMFGSFFEYDGYVYIKAQDKTLKTAQAVRLFNGDLCVFTQDTYVNTLLIDRVGPDGTLWFDCEKDDENRE